MSVVFGAKPNRMSTSFMEIDDLISEDSLLLY